MSPPSTPGLAETSEWSAHLNQQKVGPFTLAQLRLLVDAGELRPDDQVLPPGTDQWVPVSAVPELAAPRPAPASRPQVTASRTPGSAEPLLWPVPPDEDDEPPRRQPLKSGGFWHWYRTRPWLVVLLAVFLLVLALLPVLLTMLFIRQQRLQAMIAVERAMMAEMQAREMAEQNRAEAEAALRKAQQVLGEQPPQLAEQPKEAFAFLRDAEPLKPADGDDELRKLLKERYNAALASVKGMVRARWIGAPMVLLCCNFTWRCRSGLRQNWI